MLVTAIEYSTAVLKRMSNNVSSMMLSSYYSEVSSAVNIGRCKLIIWMVMMNTDVGEFLVLMVLSHND